MCRRIVLECSLTAGGEGEEGRRGEGEGQAGVEWRLACCSLGRHRELRLDLRHHHQEIRNKRSYRHQRIWITLLSLC